MKNFLISHRLRKLFVVFSLFTLGLPLAAQELSFGVMKESHTERLFEATGPYSMLIRNAVIQPILRIDSTKSYGYSMVLADSFSFNESGEDLSLRLKEGVSFSSGGLVENIDYLESLNRCKRGVHSDDGLIISSYSKGGRNWLMLSSKTKSKSEILNFISGCPILSAKSIKVFGDDLGAYNLVIGTGAYQLVSINKNNEARLERVKNSKGLASVIYIREFQDARHALTALRTGTLDMFFTKDNEVLDMAGSDSTLRVGDCGVYKIILRKGLVFECNPEPFPEFVKYRDG